MNKPPLTGGAKAWCTVGEQACPPSSAWIPHEGRMALPSTLLPTKPQLMATETTCDTSAQVPALMLAIFWWCPNLRFCFGPTCTGNSTFLPLKPGVICRRHKLSNLGSLFSAWDGTKRRGVSCDGLCVDRFWHGYSWSQCYSMHKTLAATWHFKWCPHHAEVSHFEQTLHCLFPLLNKMFSVPPGQTLEISLWKVVEWTGWKARTKYKSVESPPKTMWCKLSGRVWVGREEKDM